MITKVRAFLMLGAAVVVFAVAINAGAFRGEPARNCGLGVRPRSVVASATWTAKPGQERSFVRISGYIGPAKIHEPRTSKSPARFPGQACPGETAAIVVTALAGPLPSIVCGISVGGSALTGPSIDRESVAGQRAFCQAVIK